MERKNNYSDFSFEPLGQYAYEVEYVLEKCEKLLQEVEKKREEKTIKEEFRKYMMLTTNNTEK